LKTAGGDIHLEGASGTVEAKTAGGDIELCFVSGSVEAKTAGGRIKAELYPTGKGETNLETAGGDIRITLPEDAKANITAEIRLEHGWKKRKYEIRSDFKEDKMETEEGERIVGTYTLNGGGERIHLETVNSNIEIRKAVKK
jgi:DUF4097 and DUF4098 domain-containing protein YvlB